MKLLQVYQESDYFYSVSRLFSLVSSDVRKSFKSTDEENTEQNMTKKKYKEHGAFQKVQE